jgi:hypothetical protein
MSPQLLVLGRTIGVTATIPEAGETILGLSRAKSFRTASSDGWPTIGPKGARRVVIPTLLSSLGIPYEVIGIGELK